MKFAKRLTALLIVAVMLISSCMFVNAAKATVAVDGTYTVILHLKDDERKRLKKLYSLGKLYLV